MTQESLFDADAARRAAEEGMRRAENADRVAQWKSGALMWVMQRQYGDRFTADDLVRELGLPEPGAKTNNVVGAIFSKLSKQGVIVFTGQFKKSKRVIRHGNLQRVWERR